MAENEAPPAAAAINGSSDPSRGLPHYEKLRRDLRESLQKKRAIDAALAKTEENIYNLETSYLEDTTAGNIIKGFDNYIKGGTLTGGGAGNMATRRRTGINDSDRIFSRSSVSFMTDSPAATSAQTTPSHAPTPTSSFPQSARESNHPTPTNGKNLSIPTKKKKAGDLEDAEDSKPAKRGKITYGRD